MKRGDIDIVSLDPTAGHEQSGSRPVLVVSPAEFSEATRLPVILPIPIAVAPIGMTIAGKHLATR